MLCVHCQKWCHLACSGETLEFFKSNKDWICRVCCDKQLPQDQDYIVPIQESSIPISIVAEPTVPPTEELRKLKDEKGLKITHLNCLSLTKNIDELRHIAEFAI